MAEDINAYLNRLRADYQASGGTNQTRLQELIDQARNQIEGPTSAVKASSPRNPQHPSVPGDDSELGGGSGGRGSEQGGQYGALNSDQRSTIGTLSKGAGLLGGIGVPGLGILGTALSGILGIDTLTGLLGLNTIGLNTLSEPDVNAITDQQGAFAGEAARAANAQAVADWNTQIDAMRVEGNPEGSYAGARGNKEAGAPSVTNPDIDTSQPGWGSNKTSDTPTTTDTESGANSPGKDSANTDTGGHGAAGDSSMNARGGVQVASKTTKATFGEKGPETAVFIPHNLLDSRVQNPHKDQLMHSLELLLMQLKGEL